MAQEVMLVKASQQATIVETETKPRARRRRYPIVPLLILGVFIFLALFADFVAPHSPYDQPLADRLMPPAWEAGGRADHLLGTDKLGRDVLSRIIYGTRVVFQVVIALLAFGGGLGGMLGLLAGYKGGWVDTIVMRVVDATIAFPLILLALLLAVTLGPGLGTVVLAIGLIIWAGVARLVRGEVLSVRERDWVIQARINGCSDLRIMFKHIVPHVLNSWVVMVTLQMGMVILAEASLSFLGAGIPPPEPSWGRMVADGRDVLTTAWWVSIFPGVAIMLLVLAFNMMGDWLRETLDPKLRQV